MSGEPNKDQGGKKRRTREKKKHLLLKNKRTNETEKMKGTKGVFVSSTLG